MLSRCPRSRIVTRCSGVVEFAQQVFHQHFYSQRPGKGAQMLKRGLREFHGCRCDQLS